MIDFKSLEPLTPLLWIEDKWPLYTLSYLLQLNEETEKNQADLLWQLTSQILIAYDMENTSKVSINEKELEGYFKQIENNEVISSLLAQKTVEKESLKYIMKLEILEQKWVYQEKIALQEQNIDQEQNLKDLFNENKEFATKDVYEAYTCTIPNKDLKEIDLIKNPDELKKRDYKAQIILGGISKKQLQENTTKNDWNTLEEHKYPFFLKDRNNIDQYYFIFKWHDLYTPSFEDIKDSLTNFVVDQYLKDALENKAQELLDTYNITYNEKALATLIKF